MYYSTLILRNILFPIFDERMWIPVIQKLSSVVTCNYKNFCFHELDNTYLYFMSGMWHCIFVY